MYNIGPQSEGIPDFSEFRNFILFSQKFQIVFPKISEFSFSSFWNILRKKISNIFIVFWQFYSFFCFFSEFFIVCPLSDSIAKVLEKTATQWKKQRVICFTQGKYKDGWNVVTSTTFFLYRTKLPDSLVAVELGQLTLQ